MRCDRGDVVLVLFPDSNLRTAKRRPALVVQRDNLQSGIPQTIVALITSNLARSGHPSRVTVDRDSVAGKQMGLRADSVVITDNLATIHDVAIDKKIGTCPLMSNVDDSLRHTLGL